MKAKYLLIATFSLLLTSSKAQIQNLPSPDDFGREIKVCNAAQKINLDAKIIDSLAALYSDETSRQALRSVTDFLLLIPEDKRIDAYRLYAQCIVKLVPQLASTAPASSTITRQYRICTGEYERACQPHDVYLYCAVPPESWARERCATYSIMQLNNYGGNKCGYGLYEVLCTGSK
ncbi:hypothetical protein [Bradyrhizobium diazoefficiens]|uniref:hypothetical protein n=1 Tax=Bradyrhizobium diazoefficiens TaxID=1355477 RepID=UPI0038389CC0